MNKFNVYRAGSGFALGDENLMQGLNIGIEIEMEFNRNFNIGEIGAGQGYSVVGDGSLRNGLEFITFPLPVDDALKTVKSIVERPDWKKKKPSDRCSTHVHVNMQDKDNEFVAKFFALYMILEPHLKSFLGERYNNVFCVPISQSRSAVMDIADCLSGKKIVVDRRLIKYSSLNLHPITTLGTVEFRSFGSLVDYKAFERWVRFIEHLYYSADRLENITDLADMGTDGTLDEIIDYCLDIIGEKREESCINSVRNVQNFIYKFGA